MSAAAWTHPPAEQALLGLLLGDRALIDRPDVADTLVADPAYAPAWRQLAAMARRGVTVDALSAVEVLVTAGIGNPGLLVADALHAAERTVVGAVLPTLHAFARRRLLRDAGTALSALAAHPEDAEVGSVEEVLARLRAVDAPLAEQDQPLYPVAAGAYIERLLARQAGSLPGLSTGFRVLDRLSGGIQRGELTVLAARPSIGKSAIAQQFALAVGDAGGHVGVCSPEMSRWQIMERVLASRAQVSTEGLRQAFLTPRQQEAVIAAGVALPPIWLSDAAVITTAEIAAMARRHHARTALDLLVIDHLGFLADAHARHESQTLRIGRLTKALKALGRELHCAVLLVSQLNRGAERDGVLRPPTLSDLRDSGEIEQDADAVWFLHREDRAATEATLLVAKNRGGPQGVVNLTWDGPLTMFHPREGV
jgi:replicative DNA helicase